MDNKYLWEFNLDCGRMGYLEGLFIATENEINGIIGKKVYFGEVLGKNSEIYEEIKRNDFKKIDLDSETVEKVSKILGLNWSGYNPLDYATYQSNECLDNYRVDEYNLELNLCVYCEEEKELF